MKDFLKKLFKKKIYCSAILTSGEQCIFEYNHSYPYHKAYIQNNEYFVWEDKNCGLYPVEFRER